MKKTIALILALVLSLSLCACGGNAEENPYAKYEELFNYLEAKDYEKANAYIQNFFADTQEEDPQRKKDYETALKILNTPQIPGEPSKIQTAYELLTALGDYEDAAEYLARITVIPDVLLLVQHYDVNAFGEEYLRFECHHGYDKDGKLLYGADDYDSLYNLINIYTYNEEGQIAEINVRTSYSDTTKRKETYHYTDGVLTGITEMWDNGSVYEMFYENGLLVKVEGPNEYRATFTYDDRGLLKKRENNPDEYISSTAVFEYEFDADGNVTRCTATVDDYSGKISYVQEYTYENGRLVMEYYSSDSNTYKIVYSYGDYYCYTPET